MKPKPERLNGARFALPESSRSPALRYKLRKRHINLKLLVSIIYILTFMTARPIAPMIQRLHQDLPHDSHITSTNDNLAAIGSLPFGGHFGETNLQIDGNELQSSRQGSQIGGENDQMGSSAREQMAAYLNLASRGSLHPATIKSFYGSSNYRPAGRAPEKDVSSGRFVASKMTSGPVGSGPVALGTETEYMNQPNVRDQEYLNVVMNAGEMYPSEHNTVDRRPVFEQSSVVPNNNYQEKIYYQQKAGPYGADQGSNVYSRPRGHNPRQGPFDHPKSQSTLTAGNNQQFAARHQRTNQFARATGDGPSRGRYTNLSPGQGSNLSRKKNLLTNSQLVSLIDELKEFNSKQASKIQSSVQRVGKKKEPEATETAEREERDDSKQPEDKQEREEKDSEPSGRAKSDEEANSGDKMNSDDLAKFAKFLMTKEGSNMKFQLGLEKDSPDDGDEEEDKDTLLESQNKQTKAKPRDEIPLELEDLDKKHSEVASQMDKLIKDMAGKARDAEKLLDKKKTDSEEDDSDRARKRRHNNLDAARVATNKTANVSHSRSTRERDSKEVKRKSGGSHNDNFAKALLKKELKEDEQESEKHSAQTNTSIQQPKSSGHQSGGPNEVVKKGRSKESSIQPDSTLNKIERRNVDEKYPRVERNRDHIALIHELQEARKSKSQTRSRMPLNADPVLRRALNGELGIRGEKLPNGKLQLKTSRGDIMQLRLPKRGKDDNSHGGTNNEDNIITSELKPRQVDPDSGEKVDAIKLESSRPLKDEYPISERVSDRLNKLSNNLDRYFNDGFLQEIEKKSRLNDHSGAESRQPQSSNIEESTSPEEASNGKGGPKKKRDQDFDVNVGVDGRRDVDRDNDDDDGDESSETDKGEDENESDEKGEGRAKKRNPTAANANKSGVNTKTTKRKSGNKEELLSRRRKANRDVTIKVNQDKPRGEQKARSVRRDESSKDENIVFEKQGKVIPNLDPVESESLETPIGPDTDTSEPDLSNTHRMQSSREKSLSRINGKKLPGKFYEEPEWR